MAKGMKDVLKDELLFLTFLCNDTDTVWYFELCSSNIVELYTYTSAGYKVSYILECDEKNHVILVKSAVGDVLYTSDAMSLISVAQWLCAEVTPFLDLVKTPVDFSLLRKVLHKAYRIKKTGEGFSIYSEVKGVLVSCGFVSDGEIYVPSYSTRAIDTAEECYKLLAWLNGRTIDVDANGNFALDWMTKIFNEMFSAVGNNFIRDSFVCVDNASVVVSDRSTEGYYLVSDNSDIVTMTKFTIFEVVEGSGLNLVAIPAYREPSSSLYLDAKNISQGESSKKPISDNTFNRTDDYIDGVYSILYKLIAGNDVDTSNLGKDMKRLLKDRDYYADNLNVDERCLTYVNKINVLVQNYDFYKTSGLLGDIKVPDLLIEAKDDQSKDSDSVDSNDTEVPNLPTKEQAKDNDVVDETPVPKKVQNLIDGEITSVDVRRLIYNGRTIAYRFKTNLGYYDMSIEAADKYGLSEGSLHFDKGILVELKNGLYLTQREIRERRLVREVSGNETCCEKLVTAVFTL